MPIRLALLSLLIVLGACATAAENDGIDFETCGVRPRVQVPVAFRESVPVMQATIKGQSAELILDTGATGLALTETALHRLDLQSDEKRVITSRGIGGQSQAFAGKLQDFEIDGMRVPDHPVSVLPNTSRIAAQHTVDGLFGGPVLSLFELDLDLPRNRVTLYAGHICPTTVLPPWNTPFETIDASRSANGRFLVPVQLDGKPIIALIDTGAAVSIVAADVAQALGVTPASLQSAPHATLVGTGPASMTAYVHRFHEIRFGDDVYEQPLLLVAERAEPNIDMIVGSDYLIHHHLWLSYATKRVFIARPAPAHAAAD
jgi:predicted aspartyl protease